MIGLKVPRHQIPETRVVGVIQFHTTLDLSRAFSRASPTVSTWLEKQADDS